jgi:hypothetical protein
LKSKSRGKSRGESLHGDTAQPNEQNLKEWLILVIKTEKLGLLHQ